MAKHPRNREEVIEEQGRILSKAIDQCQEHYVEGMEMLRGCWEFAWQGTKAHNDAMERAHKLREYCYMLAEGLAVLKSPPPDTRPNSVRPTEPEA